MPDCLACPGLQLNGLTIGREAGVLDLYLVFAGGEPDFPEWRRGALAFAVD
jgi:hypothetical protein